MKKIDILRQSIKEEIKNVLKESELDLTKPYAIVSTGGSIGGSKTNYLPQYNGTIYRTFDDLEDAKQTAKRLRSQLSKGQKSYYGEGYKVIKLTPNIVNMLKESEIEEASFPGRASNNKLKNIDTALQVIYPYMSKGDQALKDKTFRAYYRFYNDGDFNSLPFPFLKTLGMPEGEIQKMKNIKQNDTWDKRQAFGGNNNSYKRDYNRRMYYKYQKDNQDKYAPFLEKGLELIMKYFINKYKSVYREHQSEVMDAIKGNVNEDAFELTGSTGKKTLATFKTPSDANQFKSQNPNIKQVTKLEERQVFKTTEFEEILSSTENIRNNMFVFRDKSIEDKIEDSLVMIENFVNEYGFMNIDEVKDEDEPEIKDDWNKEDKEDQGSDDETIDKTATRGAKKSRSKAEKLDFVIKNLKQCEIDIKELVNKWKVAKTDEEKQPLISQLKEKNKLKKELEELQDLYSDTLVKEGESISYDIKDYNFKQLQDLVDISNPSGTSKDRYKDPNVIKANKILYKIGFYTSDDRYGEIEYNLDGVTKTKDGKTLKDLNNWFEKERHN